jgi:hypothetical protein
LRHQFASLYLSAKALINQSVAGMPQIESGGEYMLMAFKGSERTQYYLPKRPHDTIAELTGILTAAQLAVFEQE